MVSFRIIRRAIPAVVLPCVAALGACRDALAPDTHPGVELNRLGASQLRLAKAGDTVYGRNNNIRYFVGNGPIILLAPHGGPKGTSEWPARRCGVNSNDVYAPELARAMRLQIYRQTGRWPHLIENRLDRKYLDANRDVAEATCGSSLAAISWREYHTFVDSAKARAVARYGAALVLDVHGQSNDARINVGYSGLSGQELRRGRSTIEAQEASSSIRHVSRRSPLTYERLVRGSHSFGSLLSAAGYRAIVGQRDSMPATADTAEYRWGGYSVNRHGSRDGGTVSALLLENNRAVRSDLDLRARYARDIVPRVLAPWMREHMGIEIRP